MNNKLKAYTVHCGEPEIESLLVYHYTGRGAKKLGWDNWDVCYSYMDIRAERMPDADTLVRADATVPYVENDRSVLRKAGWRIEGDRRCSTCGLSEMDGDFPVCDECCQCCECGHEEGCDLADCASLALESKP